MLANEQVVDGACERCGATAEKKKLTQWYLKITDYADRLLDLYGFVGVVLHAAELAARTALLGGVAFETSEEARGGPGARRRTGWRGRGARGAR